MVVDRQKLIDALEKVEVVVRDYNKVVILDLNLCWQSVHFGLCSKYRGGLYGT